MFLIKLKKYKNRIIGAFAYPSFSSKNSVD